MTRPPRIERNARGDVVSYTWDDILHVLDEIRTGANRNWTCRGSVDRAPSQSWDANTKWEGALKMLREGWHDGAKVSAQLAQRVPPKLRSSGEAYGMVGRKVSIGRYLAGDPHCMKRRVRSSSIGRGHAIRLAVNVAVNASVDARNIQNYGAALVACIDELESAGFSVELSVHSIFRLSSVKFVTGYLVKESGQSLNYGQMAFCVGHPASERRIQFALAERTPVQYQSPGYGGAGDLYLSDVPDLPSHAVVLNGWSTANTHSATLESAAEHMRETLGAALGGDYAERIGWRDG